MANEQQTAGRYRIEPAQSEVGFTVKRLGVLKIEGRFDAFEGIVRFDPEDLGTASVELKIDAASIRTGQAARDVRVRSADFLDVAQHPHITFESTEAGSVDVNTFKLAGTLTLRAIPREVVFDVTYLGSSKDAQGRPHAQFEARATIHRTDFDVAWSRLAELGGMLVGDKVELRLALQAVGERERV